MEINGKSVVLNNKTGRLGIVECVKLSPYYAEEVSGVLRFMVWAEMESQPQYASWDYWRLEDTTYVTSDMAVSL